MNIGEILTKTGQITWKYKILWLFGILASCVEGGSGGGGGGGGGGNGSGSGGTEFSLPPEVEAWLRDVAAFFNNLESNPGQYLGWFVLIGLLFCVLWLLMLALGTMGRIGLVKGASLADQGAESLSFGELWRASLPYFWPVAGMWLGLWMATFVFFVGVGLLSAVVAFASLGLGLVCLIPFLCLLVPVFWLISLLFEQATIAIVTEERSIPEGLSRAWALIRANIGNYLLMALMLFIIQVAVGFVLALPVFLLIVPAIFGFASGSSETIWTTLMVMGACFVVYIPVLIVLAGVLRTYVWTAWTLTFRRLSGAPLGPASSTQVLDVY
jgi:hypothetical protein